MPITTGTVNPTSTIAVNNPVSRTDSANSNDFEFQLTPSGTQTFKIDADAYPCAFFLTSNNSAAASHGIIVCPTASIVDLTGAVSGLDDGAPSATTDIGVTISSGTVTLTAGSTITNPTTVRIVRIA
jgi:hypothetical protein